MLAIPAAGFFNLHVSLILGMLALSMSLIFGLLTISAGAIIGLLLSAVIIMFKTGRG